MKRCTKCMFPETYETIEFDANGVCNICNQSDVKANIDWDARKKRLDEVIEKYRGKADYDCIVPFSGGKDSTFTLYYLMKEYGIKPLVVRFDHGFFRPTLQDNVTRVLKQLGADSMTFTPNWRIVKRVMLESFRRKTDFCWHCHTGIYSFPMRIATKFRVPLIIWGEALAEHSAYYTFTRDEIEYEDERKFNMVRNLGMSADDMYGMINAPDFPVDRRDLLPYTYPSLKELRELGYLSVCLGSFIPWDFLSQTKLIMDELGWKNDELEGVPADVNRAGWKIECFMQGARDYIKFAKRGYSRMSQITSFEIRNNRMTREQALPLVEEYDGQRPPSVDILLGYLGITEEEFNQAITAQMVPPYEHNFATEKTAAKTWDYPTWYKEDNRPKPEGETE